MPDGCVVIVSPSSDGTWTYTWQNGRQLVGMSKSGTAVSFKYNAAGLRTRKIVNGVMTKYTLHGKNVVHMTKGNDNLHFFYDAQNRPAVVVYNGTAYAYVKNLQGDIIAILNSSGTSVVSYTYDAWGTPTGTTGSMAATLGVLNPFRYRGYVYDEETGLYHLRSRYYHAEWCRFINTDSKLSLQKLNPFAYCGNMPIVQVDYEGTEGVDFRSALPYSNFKLSVYMDGTVFVASIIEGCDLSSEELPRPLPYIVQDAIQIVLFVADKAGIPHDYTERSDTYIPINIDGTRNLLIRDKNDRSRLKETVTTAAFKAPGYSYVLVEMLHTSHAYQLKVHFYAEDGRLLTTSPLFDAIDNESILNMMEICVKRATNNGGVCYIEQVSFDTNFYNE